MTQKHLWTLLATGPSLNQKQADYIRGKSNVLVINDSYRIAPWADCLYACDMKWWQWQYKDHQAKIEAFQGEKWTLDKEAAEKYGLFHINSEANKGLSTDPDIIYQGMNSGYQAINLAYHFGARKIILLGYDMQQTGGNKHWFGNHPDDSQPNYNTIKQLFDDIAQSMASLKLEIINCTEITALTSFPRKELKSVL